MLTSGSILVDALIATLVSKSASIFDSSSPKGNLTKDDWGRLDTTTSGCIYILFAPAFAPKEFAFGNAQYVNYSISIKCCIRDTGNSVETMNKTFQAEPDLRAAIMADDTLGGSAMKVWLARGGGWNGETFLSSQNSTTVWIPLDFVIECETVG